MSLSKSNHAQQHHNPEDQRVHPRRQVLWLVSRVLGIACCMQVHRLRSLVRLFREISSPHQKRSDGTFCLPTEIVCASAVGEQGSSSSEIECGRLCHFPKEALAAMRAQNRSFVQQIQRASEAVSPRTGEIMAGAGSDSTDTGGDDVSSNEYGGLFSLHHLTCRQQDVDALRRESKSFERVGADGAHYCVAPCVLPTSDHGLFSLRVGDALIVLDERQYKRRIDDHRSYSIGSKFEYCCAPDTHTCNDKCVGSNSADHAVNRPVKQRDVHVAIRRLAISRMQIALPSDHIVGDRELTPLSTDEDPVSQNRLLRSAALLPHWCLPTRFWFSVMQGTLQRAARLAKRKRDYQLVATEQFVYSKSNSADFELARSMTLSPTDPALVLDVGSGELGFYAFVMDEDTNKVSMQAPAKQAYEKGKNFVTQYYKEGSSGAAALADVLFEKFFPLVISENDSETGQPVRAEDVKLVESSSSGGGVPTSPSREKKPILLGSFSESPALSSSSCSLKSPLRTGGSDCFRHLSSTSLSPTHSPTAASLFCLPTILLLVGVTGVTREFFVERSHDVEDETEAGGNSSSITCGGGSTDELGRFRRWLDQLQSILQSRFLRARGPRIKIRHLDFLAKKKSARIEAGYELAATRWLVQNGDLDVNMQIIPEVPRTRVAFCSAELHSCVQRILASCGGKEYVSFYDLEAHFYREFYDLELDDRLFAEVCESEELLGGGVAGEGDHVSGREGDHVSGRWASTSAVGKNGRMLGRWAGLIAARCLQC